MHKIEAPGATQDNTFTEGNPSTGAEATEVSAAWLNAVQGELVKVIEGAGLTLKTADTETSDQLLAALNRLAARSVTTVTAADSPKVLTVAEAGLVLVDASGGAVLLTLPSAASNAAVGYRIVRIDTASANAVTINPDGTDTIGGAVSLDLVVGDRRALLCDGTSAWRRPEPVATESEPGMLPLANAAEAQALSSLTKLLTPGRLADSFKGTNQSLANNGYQILPGGLIIQWGALVASSGTTVSLPIAFPNIGRAVAGSADGGTAFAVDASMDSSFVQLTLRHSSGGGIAINWMAIGY